MKKILFIYMCSLFFLSCGDGVNPPRITLYLTPLVQGNFGPRDLADQFCRSAWDLDSAELSKVSQRSNSHAVISYSTGNSVNQMSKSFPIPEGLPVYAKKEKVANTWNDFVYYGVKKSLAEAGLNSSGIFWSGSDAFGAYNPNNCTNFTGASVSSLGSTLVSSQQVLNHSTSGSCAGIYYPVLCMTF